jgi:hypothetical protein
LPLPTTRPAQRAESTSVVRARRIVLSRISSTSTFMARPIVQPLSS